MQTFVPEKTYAKCAAVLDRQRLGKQRVECLQIMNVITGKSTSKGWQNHPACNMWRENPKALLSYQAAVCKEWTDRGYKDTCLQKTADALGVKPPEKETYPKWWGDYRVHASHRSNLLRKEPSHYRQHWPEDSEKLEYYWPTKEDQDEQDV
jgi:hypothetical protein